MKTIWNIEEIDNYYTHKLDYLDSSVKMLDNIWCVDTLTTNVKTNIGGHSSMNTKKSITNKKVVKGPGIKNVDFQPPLTVIIWDDGTKTFVKAAESDTFDPEKGIAMAIAKKYLGDKYNYIEIINYYVDRFNRKKNKD